MTNPQTSPIPNGAAAVLQTEKDHFELVDINRIRKADSNPRKHFDEEKLNELAASMGNGVGVIEPLILVPCQGFDADYKLVAGERRWRAARIAGLHEVPALIKHLTHLQIRVIQLIENRSREDIHPLEEADEFHELVALGLTPHEIALKLGCKDRYVNERLRLFPLIPQAREHFYAGRLTIAHYLTLARLDPASQKKALLHAWSPDWKQQSTDDEYPPNLEAPKTAKEFNDYIKQNFFLSLKAAPWSLTDAALYKKAGPCSSCETRTGQDEDREGSQIMRRCKFCQCSQFDPCIDPATGATCAWVTEDICSFCVEYDETADFVLMARFAHELAQQIRQDYTPNDHEGAAALYGLACAGLITFGTEMRT